MTCETWDTLENSPCQMAEAAHNGFKQGKMKQAELENIHRSTCQSVEDIGLVSQTGLRLSQD